MFAKFAKETISVEMLLFSTIAILTLIPSFIRQLEHPLYTCADQSLYLEIANLLLEGKVPYRDFFEWNPPLFFYGNILPLLISRIAGIHPILTFNIFSLALSLIAVIGSLLLGKKYLDNETFKILGLVPAGFALLSRQLIYDLGEREHYFIMFYLPFFFLRVCKAEGRQIPFWISLLCGVTAGYCIALKPQFLVCVIAAETVLFITSRLPIRQRLKELLAIEYLSVYAWELVHLMIIVTLPAEAVEVFANEVVPLYAEAYVIYERSIFYQLGRGHELFFNRADFMIWFLAANLLQQKKYSKFTCALTAFGLVGLGLYLFQGQAWIYRRIPLDFAGLSVLAILLSSAYFAYTDKFGARRQAACAVAFTAATGWFQFNECAKIVEEAKSTEAVAVSVHGFSGKCPKVDFPPLFFEIEKRTSPSDRVIFIGSVIDPGYPGILQAKRKCGSRYLFSNLALLEYAKQNLDNQRWTSRLNRVIQNYVTDIDKNSPALIAVEPFFDNNILRKNPDFINAVKRYSRIESSDLLMYVLKNESRPEKDSVFSRAVLDILCGKSTVEKEANRLAIPKSDLQKIVQKVGLFIQELEPNETAALKPKN